MCPMDSIAEFIFVFNGKASRVNDCMSSLLFLCLQFHPSARTREWVGWQWDTALASPQPKPKRSTVVQK